MATAELWTNVTATTSSITDGWERYIQYQAILTSSSDNLETPLLKDVTIDWPGETKLVNIGGSFIKSSSNGVFTISVDGQKLTSAMTVDLEIFKDVRSMNNITRRIRSSTQVEISPRNTNF